MEFFIDIGYWVFNRIFDFLDFIEYDDYSVILSLYKYYNSSVALIIGVVFSLIVLIIILKILGAMGKSASSKTKRSNRTLQQNNLKTNQSNVNRQSVRTSKNKMYNISDNLEDKSSDWLAMQYKDEERSRITCIAGEIVNPIQGRPMTARDLKNYHSGACDAKFLFQDHSKDHNKN